MALLTGDVLNHARDLHPALSTANAPNVLGLRALSRMQRTLVEEIAVRVPAFLATEVTATIPTDFTVGIDLTALIPSGWMDLDDVFFTLNSAVPPLMTPQRVRAAFPPYAQRDMPQRLPAVTLKGNALYVLGDPISYSDYVDLRVTYTPLPMDFTQLTDAMILPSDARECLAHMLASFWLNRLVGKPNFDVDADAASLYMQVAQNARSTFLRRIWSTAQRQTSTVRDVRR